MKKIQATKTISQTGKKISEIGFGTYRFYKTPEHKAVLKKALLSGINLIDTSSNYTNGLSSLNHSARCEVTTITLFTNTFT